MAVPAFISHSHIVVTLVAELDLISVTIHAGTVQTDGIYLFVTRLVGSNPIPYDREFPVLQKRFMIDPNEGFRFNALFLRLICGKLGFGNIAALSAHRVVPDRIGDQPKKDDQS